MQNCTPVDPEVNLSQRATIDSLLQTKIKTSFALPLDRPAQLSAIEILDSALVLPGFELASDSLQSKTFFRLGCFYYNIAEYASAKKYLDTAIARQLVKENNEEELSLANSYYTRSVILQNQYKFEDALNDVNSAIKIIENYPDQKQTKGKYYSQAGHFYSNLNEQKKAQEFFEQAKPLLAPKSKELADYYNEYGQYHEYQGNFELAIENYDQALAIYSKLPNQGSRSAPIKFNRFDLLTEIQPYKKADQNYSSFLASFVDSTNQLKNYKLMGYNNLAWLNYNNDDLNAAEKNYQGALALAKELSQGKHSVDLGTSYEGLGDVAHARNQYDQAISLYHTALMALSVGFASDNPYDLPNLKDHVILNESLLERIWGLKAAAIFDKSKSTGKLADLEATFYTYQQLDQLLVKMRQGYKAAMSRYDLVSRTIPYYEKATLVALELYQRTQQMNFLEAAYSFASKNKAVIMLDGLQDEQARFAGIPKALLEKEAAIKKEIYELDGKIYDRNQNLNTSQLSLQDLTNLRFKKTRAYEDLIDQLEVDYPKYYQLKYANNFEIDVNKLRSQLPENGAVMEYFIGENNIYIFSFSKNNDLHCEVTEIEKEFSQQCLSLRNMTEKDSLTTMADFSRIANGLYETLLEPTLERLTANSEIKRLSIIPDDILMQVSFETFLTKPLDTLSEQWTNPLPYLLRDFAISYSYSNQLLFDETANTRIAQRKTNYIGFGLEYDDYTLSAIEQMHQREELPPLSRGMGKLIYSDDEVIAVANIMGGKYFVNARATKSNFLKEAEKASILHLGTHGYVVRTQPLNSGLIFTKQHEKDDFILKAADLYSINLQADMAVLSACHTGDGKIQKGEGIRSLARAFNFAGCPNVTASLWAAPDLSTKEIMVSFYQFIKNGEPIDISLNQAKLEYLDNCAFDLNALPCNWAHLVSIGNIEPLQ